MNIRGGVCRLKDDRTNYSQKQVLQVAGLQTGKDLQTAVVDAWGVRGPCQGGPQWDCLLLGWRWPEERPAGPPAASPPRNQLCKTGQCQNMFKLDARTQLTFNLNFTGSSIRSVKFSFSEQLYWPKNKKRLGNISNWGLGSKCLILNFAFQTRPYVK